MGKRKRNDHRFDRLPEEIIHHILSFLSPEKAAQTSVLSKTWLQAWSTYPNLEFNQTLFYKRLQARAGGRISEKRKKFVEFVDNNLARYSNHNLPIKRFVLSLEVFTSKLWSSVVDKWLGTALDMGVEELSLALRWPFRNRAWNRRNIKYTLPQKIFSAKQLTSLRVSGSLISISLKENDRALVGNLKSLHLTGVHFDEQTFRKLCSSCRLIEDLSLHICSEMNRIEVCHLPNLKKLHVIPYTNAQIVVITDTPSLEAVTIFNYRHDQLALCFEINLSALQILKILELSCSNITDGELGNLISQCPLLDRLVLRKCHALTRVNITNRKLKSLTLDACYPLKRVNITSQTLMSLTLDACNALTRVNITSQALKSLTLDSCYELAKAKIDAPNLLSFRYTGGHIIPSVSLISSLSERFESVICLNPYYDMDASSFIRIRRLLASLSNCVEFRVNISLANICFNVDKIPLLPDQPKVKSLIIRTFLSSKSKTYKSLVDGLLWTCHPETLEIEKFRRKVRTIQ